MAGQTVKAAVDKYCADKDKTRAGSGGTSGPAGAAQRSKHIKHNAASEAYITLEGVDYRRSPHDATPAPSSLPSTSTGPSANFAHIRNDAVPTANLHTDEIPAGEAYESWAVIEDPHVSIDWNVLVNLALTVASAENDFTIFADTGANVHISPCREDFLTFTEIAPQPIRGFQTGFDNLNSHLGSTPPPPADSKVPNSSTSQPPVEPNESKSPQVFQVKIRAVEGVVPRTEFSAYISLLTF